MPLKRKLPESFDSDHITHKKSKSNPISQEFLNHCEKEFKANPVNILARNAITSVGSTFSCINSEKANTISHIFLNTLRKKGVPATNQGSSGRCWMFAGLNIFRHNLIHAYNLENFEFSQTYLFLWDKLERFNSVLDWFEKYPNSSLEEKSTNYMLHEYMNDGGWWNSFTNLVKKYGLIPKSVMTETYQSDSTEEMNRNITYRLHAVVSRILKGEKISRETEIKAIYTLLVKFLGQPPKKFNWTFSHEGDEETAPGAETILNLTPHTFFKLVSGGIEIDQDYTVLSHIPFLLSKNIYRISTTDNIQGKALCTLFNTSINNLREMTVKSLKNGLPVWFVGDVNKHFNWYYSSLDEGLTSSELLLGEVKGFDLKERHKLGEIQGNHAMTITGFNEDKHGKITSFQVENSWGYSDKTELGQDGFLTMSVDWFNTYVTQVVILTSLLSRNLTNAIRNSTITVLNPWDCVAPALKVGGKGVPNNYSCQK